MSHRHRSRWGACLAGIAGALRAAAALAAHGTLTLVPGVGLAPPAGLNGFNPLLVSSAYDQQAAGLMFQPLLWIDRHLTVRYAWSIAQSVRVTDHDRRFTIVLKHHWLWSDGRPVTARDVAFTYHLIQQLGPRFPNYGAGGMPTDVTALRIVNRHELTVTTKRPVNPRWFTLNGLSLLVPLPARAWSRFSIPALYDHMTDLRFFRRVDGPYHLTAFAPGRYAVFTANRRYSGPDRPHIRRLVFRFLKSPESVFFALRAHRLQLGNLPMALYRGRRALRGFRAYPVGPVWGFNSLGFDYANPRIAFIRDPRVRQAFMHAINQDELITVLAGGHGMRDYGPIPPHPPTFLSRTARRLEVTGAYDPARARRLLKAAGWRRDGHAVRRKNGVRLAFTAYVVPGDVRAPILIKDMLARIGVDMHLREKPFNEIVAATGNPRNTHWQAVFLAWGLSPYPSVGNIFACGAANNDYHYCNPRLDRLLRAITTPGAHRALARFQNVFTQEQPVIVLPEQPIIVEVARTLRGLHQAFSPLGGFNPAALWFAKTGRRP